MTDIAIGDYVIIDCDQQQGGWGPGVTQAAHVTWQGCRGWWRDNNVIALVTAACHTHVFKKYFFIIF